MRVLLTGATGYVGSGVADVLRESGHAVCGLARSERSAKKLEERGFAAARGDLSGAKSVERAARDFEAEAVVHAAASDGPDPAGDERTFLRGAFAALEGSGAVLVYTSGGWVMGDTGTELADERSPLRPTASLAWRPSVEEFALSEGSARGVRPVVVRPALVYGGGGGVVGEMVAFAKEHGRARYVVRPGAEAYWTLVHRRDVGRLDALVLGLDEEEKEQKLGRGLILIAAGGPPVPAREVAEAASRAAGAGGRVEGWPLEEARREFGSYAEDLALDQRLSGEKARRLLGFEPASPGVFEELVGTSERRVR